jgi:outer membrane lipoprotein-sorting protein
MPVASTLIKIILAILCIVLSGCATARFNSVVGEPESVVLQKLGTPTRQIQLANGDKIWSYQIVSDDVWAQNADEPETMTEALAQEIAEKVADKVVDSNIGHSQPARNVYINQQGIATKWERTN